MSASDNMDLTFQDWEDYFERKREEQKQISPPDTVDYGTGLLPRFPGIDDPAKITESSVVARWTMEQTPKANAALIEAAESEIEALVIEDHNSSGQIAHNIVQLLLGKIRGQA